MAQHAHIAPKQLSNWFRQKKPKVKNDFQPFCDDKDYHENNSMFSSSWRGSAVGMSFNLAADVMQSTSRPSEI